METNQLQIASLNINIATSETRIAVFESFIRCHELDIVFLQEVAVESLERISGYTIVTNIGTENRGTALLAKEHLILQNIARLPSGRGIAADLNGIRLVNIYAPSGAKKDAIETTFSPQKCRLCSKTFQ